MLFNSMFQEKKGKEKKLNYGCFQETKTLAQVDYECLQETAMNLFDLITNSEKRKEID